MHKFILYMRDFIKYQNYELSTNVEISYFSSLANGVSEYMAIIKGNDTSLPFIDQLNNIKKSLDMLPDRCGGASAVFARFFLSDISNQRGIVEEIVEDYTDCSFSIIGQPPLDGTKVALFVYLQSAMESKSYPDGLLSQKHGSYTHYWGASAFNKAANSEYQMRLLFNEYVMQLANKGCTLYNNCIRTWIFVQDIDVNYHMVVKARNEVFASQNLISETHYIASTGIAGVNGDPKVSVQMDTYAIDGLKEGQVKYLYASHHLNRTSEYGVSFERGTSVIYGDRTHTFISGTASIDHKGEILFAGDVIKQAERACENVEALLTEAECSFDDVMHIIVYLRDISDYANVSSYYDSRFTSIPKVYVLAPVCRPGWLVEMECIAINDKRNDMFENF